MKLSRLEKCCIGAVGLFCVAVVYTILTPGAFLPPHGRRLQCLNRIRNTGLALEEYHATYNSFPPAFIADANGKPMHSWRVLILPYLDQAALYKRYRFDEPWDGPNNSQLRDDLSFFKEFECPETAGQMPGHTSFLVVVGPETVFPGSTSTRYEDITDGATTLLLVEVENSGIHWMEPRDLHFEQVIAEKSVVSSKHEFPNVAFVGFRAIPASPELLKPAQLQKLLTIRGGEEVELDHR
ncbi:MAG: DUF1559 domain-containing protein [Planctomycetaceae bacterium]